MLDTNILRIDLSQRNSSEDFVGGKIYRTLGDFTFMWLIKFSLSTEISRVAEKM